MSKKYKNSLSIIGFFIICCFGLLVAYNYREKNNDDAFHVVGSENLSINFFGDKKISVRDSEVELKFSISNNTDKDIFYTINAEDIKNFNDKVSVSLINENNNFVIEKTSKSEKVLLDNNQLTAYETENFTLKVTNKSDDNFSFDIMVNEVANNEDTFAKSILKNNELTNPKTIIGTNVAILNEGLISDIDENGPTYYFRGNITNNYVSFANMTWRIVRINGDGTVRLVLNNNLDSVHNYTANIENYSFNNSDLKLFLDEWYSIFLEEYDNFIALGKYCNDNNLSEKSGYYNAYTRIVTNNIPTFSCLGDRVSGSVGLLTVDELVYAGASIKDNNSDFYLYNKDSGSFWTMSGAKNNNSNYYPFVLNENGKIIYDNVATLNRGVRPVINIKANVSSTGNGTVENPYIINIKN